MSADSRPCYRCTRRSVLGDITRSCFRSVLSRTSCELHFRFTARVRQTFQSEKIGFGESNIGRTVRRIKPGPRRVLSIIFVRFVFKPAHQKNSRRSQSIQRSKTRHEVVFREYTFDDNTISVYRAKFGSNGRTVCRGDRYPPCLLRGRRVRWQSVEKSKSKNVFIGADYFS